MCGAALLAVYTPLFVARRHAKVVRIGRIHITINMFISVACPQFYSRSTLMHKQFCFFFQYSAQFLIVDAWHF